MTNARNALQDDRRIVLQEYQKCLDNMTLIYLPILSTAIEQRLHS